MGRNLVWCTFGTFNNNYDRINLEPFCDFGFIPLYTRGRDSFLDDSHPIAQKMIAKAAISVNTSYVINVPHRNNSVAARDMDETAGKAKMVEYWTAKRIYHYAVLDLEIKPWSNLAIHNEVKAVFNLLKYQVMDWVNRSTEWNTLPSLSVSFSLCTRVYNASGAKKIDHPCRGVETFTSAELCLVKRRYKELEISIALFDVECEDWDRNCTGRDLGLRGTERLRETTPYAHNLTYEYLIGRLSCP
ncbi:hypothetical protein V5799_019552 [Amblyomma americanum]|uniref:Uncharacterized protein n=1 Tax=Amblyomma americanum TaxID=6943 RepID=A0AAQ4EW66_AMBAM